VSGTASGGNVKGYRRCGSGSGVDRAMLITAPTRLGQDLAAFLTVIEVPVKAGLDGRPEDATPPAYASPLTTHIVEE